MRAISVFIVLAGAAGLPTTPNSPKPILVSRHVLTTEGISSSTGQRTISYQQPPAPQLNSATRQAGVVRNAPALALIIACAALLAAGSIVLLAFATLPSQTIPIRNLVAAAAIAIASILLEGLVGHPRRAAFVGRTISEVGQALAIASAGWMSFSVCWANGFGALLTPGRKPVLNAAAVLGCTAAAAAYGRVRPASRAQTAVPFASALVMLHMHLLIREADLDALKLAPMAVASAVLALIAIGLDAVVQRAVHAPAETEASKASAPRSSSRPLARSPGRSPVPSSATNRYLRHVRGTADMVIASLAVNVAWTFLTLCKWTGQEAPSWGFVAISACLSAVELGLRAAFGATPAAAQPARQYYLGPAATYYRWLAYWLADLCAWRTLWPDTPYDTDSYWWRRLSDAEKAERLRRALRKREKHFFSLIGAFSLWGATCAAGGRPIASLVAVAMVLLVVFKTAISSLFEAPLVMAGLLGLALGAALIALVVRLVGDADTLE